MPFAAALSGHPDAASAVGELVGEVTEQLGVRPDLAVLFVSAAHVGDVAQVAATIQSLLDPRAFIGATAIGVVGGSQGIEDAPGMSLWAARVPGRITPFHLEAQPDGDAWRIVGMPTAEADAAGTMLLLPDPFTFPLAELIAELGTARPDLSVVGGLASAASRAGGNRLVIGGRVVRHGAVGVLLDAALAPTTVVSQGCRPIGRPFTVTRSERNVLFELAGRPALERLMEVVESLSPDEKLLVSQGVHCGIVADEHQADFERGDFLVRAVLGADRENGAIAVGENVPVGATVQFQVRDASTAAEDLRSLLAGHRSEGALVFTCNGRGAAMFGDADHDARIVSDQLGRPAIAGMFCAGEIGPVAGRTAIHGFTASIALFRD